MRYHDFLLRLDAGPGDLCTVRLILSQAGQDEGTFAIPVSPHEVQRLAEALERTAAASRSGRGAALLGSFPVPSPSDLGGRIFQALFPPPIRSRYDESLGKLGPDDGLRILLQIGTGDAARGPLHAVPWECLYQAAAGAFLARSRRTPIVRQLALPLPGGRPPVPPPLRVLTVASEPSDLPVLGLALEAAALERLGRGVRVVPLPRADLGALRAALLAGGVHVLHFLGHGGSGADGQGVLYFTGEDGRAVEVGAADLAAYLRDVTSLRLVVLNACQTAQTGNAGALATVAGALLQAGVPAVVAMQFPVSDKAALAFSEAFYRRLAAGDPVEAAVTEGRLAIVGRLSGSIEWITPVLYLRAPDGQLVLPNRARTLRTVAAGAMAAALLAAGGAYLTRSMTPTPAGEENPAGTRGGSEPVQDTEPATPPETAAGVPENPLDDAGRASEPAEPEATEAPLPTTSPASLPEIGAPLTPLQDRQTGRGRVLAPEEPAAAPSPRPASPAEGRVQATSPRTPAAPRTYVLSSGTPVYLSEIQSYLTADFLTLDGEGFVRLTLATDGGDSDRRAVLAPGQLTFELPAGPRTVQVLAVDAAGRTLTVRPVPR